MTTTVVSTIVADSSIAVAVSEACSYIDQIIGFAPIVYWPLNELDGDIAFNYGTLGADANGSYGSGVTKAQIVAPNGSVAPYFNGAGAGSYSAINIYTPAFSGAFNGSEGTVLLWCKYEGSWSDNLYRDAVNIECPGVTNQFSLTKASYYADANIFECYWNPYPNGDMLYSEIASFNDDWACLVMSWSESEDAFRVYKNGIQEGSTQSGLGSWTETTNRMAIGAAYAIDPFYGYNGWIGNIAHVAFWTSVLSDDDVLSLYNGGL